MTGADDAAEPQAELQAELHRLTHSPDADAPWRLWGPYVSGRQWGTVREDYSADGDAWSYFPFEVAHRRAYRWGEDGIGAFCDRFGFFNLGVALWNRADDRLKERYFGLTNAQGNHGEDVKEIWWALDGTPTHSYASMLYRYPQRAYPYADLLAETSRRDRTQPEYEITDTGVFDENRFFDVRVEYAKASETDLVMQVTVTNQGPDAAPLDLVVQGWFRNTWAWGDDDRRPTMRRTDGTVEFDHAWLGKYQLAAEGDPRILFCDNETDMSLFEGAQPVTDCPKNGIDRAVVHGDTGAVRDDQGTKVAFHWALDQVAPGQSHTVRVRLTGLERAGSDDVAPIAPPAPTASDEVLRVRAAECDAFYAGVIPSGTSDEDAHIARRAFAGLLWNKQLYRYPVAEWLDGDPDLPPPHQRREAGARNVNWGHLELADIISMPDEWEYPWFATWDLAFHTVAFAHIDPDFAKRQLELMCWEWAQHPNGQLPAYEWNFEDVNPPVHAWACWQVYCIDGSGDDAFLLRTFSKLLMNFSWWINRKDADGSYLFEGGFLGMDNIGFFDRSEAMPDGSRLEQSDATSWMAFYALSMLRIAIRLAHNTHLGFDATARTFFSYFLRLTRAMDNFGSQGVSLWSEQDGFYYDVVVHADGSSVQLPVRSLVGLLPLIAVESVHPAIQEQLPGLIDELRWLARRDPDLDRVFVQHRSADDERITLSLVDDARRHRLLTVMLDEAEFLSPHGIRSVSKVYEDPFTFHLDGQDYEIAYAPGESTSAMFGGNSNWRGPVWFPVNHLLLDALRAYAAAEPEIECEFPTGSGHSLTLPQVAEQLRERLVSMFRMQDGARPSNPRWMPTGPLWDEHVTFSEYFHGDTGAGLGATHQAGWTALVADLICAPQGTRD